MSALAASIADTVTGMRKVITRDQSCGRHDPTVCVSQDLHIPIASDSDEPYLRPPGLNLGRKRKRQSLVDDFGGGSYQPKQLKKVILISANYGERRLKHRSQLSMPGSTGISYIEIPNNPMTMAFTLLRAGRISPLVLRPLISILTQTSSSTVGITPVDLVAVTDSFAELLRPLTSVASLPAHQSLSTVYTSNTLGHMVQHSCQILQKEKKMLATAKRLLTRFRGDDIWVPPGNFADAHDSKIFDTIGIIETVLASVTTHANSSAAQTSPTMAENLSHHEPVSLLQRNRLSIEIDTPTESGNISRLRPDHPEANGEDVVIKAEQADIQSSKDNHTHGTFGATKTIRLGSTDAEAQHLSNELYDNSNRRSEVSKVFPSVEDERGSIPQVNEIANGNDSGIIDRSSKSPTRRVTRAQAQAEKHSVSSRSDSPALPSVPQIHPLFLLSEAVKPDPDLGLPTNEAQDTRQLLILYVQKQEEVCRNAERLYEKLLLADRQRHEVLKWCKAEGHVGEMSDGEDWYDKEEWGLEEDLRKGHAEEEDDILAQGKKARGRRA